MAFAVVNIPTSRSLQPDDDPGNGSKHVVV
jgi:hypothetical protein